MYIDVYKGDDNFVTSGATLLSDLDLQETYRAIDSVATGRIPSLFCATNPKSALLCWVGKGNPYNAGNTAGAFQKYPRRISRFDNLPNTPNNLFKFLISNF